MITREEVYNSIVYYFSEINGDITIDENTTIAMVFDNDERTGFVKALAELNWWYSISLDFDDIPDESTIGELADAVMKQVMTNKKALIPEISKQEFDEAYCKVENGRGLPKLSDMPDSTIFCHIGIDGKVEFKPGNKFTPVPLDDGQVGYYSDGRMETKDFYQVYLDELERVNKNIEKFNNRLTSE